MRSVYTGNTELYNSLDWEEVLLVLNMAVVLGEGTFSTLWSQMNIFFYYTFQAPEQQGLTSPVQHCMHHRTELPKTPERGFGLGQLNPEVLCWDWKAMDVGLNNSVLHGCLYTTSQSSEDNSRKWTGVDSNQWPCGAWFLISYTFLSPLTV